MANEKIIWDFLKSNGLTNAGAAGLMGNLFAESSLIPSNLQNTINKKLGLTDAEYTQKVNDGIYTNFIHDGAGYGLAQWSYYSRKQSLLNYARSTGRSIGDLNMQLEFLISELKNSFPKVWNVLISSNNLQECSNIVLKEFERSARKDEASVQMTRRQYGQKYLDMYKGSVPSESQAVKEENINVFSTMKYDDSRPPLVCMQKNSTCYKGTRKLASIKGILWHSTGANNPWLKRYVQPHETDVDYKEMIALLGKNTNKNDWNHIYRTAGLNAWIGKLANGEITSIQTMPWNYMPWGCGQGRNGSCNNGWIQFEICEDALTDRTYFEAVFEEACQLTAFLCRKFDINPKGTTTFNKVKVPTILCHWDSYELGLGSGHEDVYHWFKKYGKDMNDVRERVAQILSEDQKEEEEMTQEKFNEMMNNYLASLAAEPADDWSLEARQYCESKGLIQGDQNGNKMYKKPLNRQEIATILYRLGQMGVIK